MGANEQPVGVPQPRVVCNNSNSGSEEYSSSYTSDSTPAAVNQKKDTQEKEKQEKEEQQKQDHT